MTLTSKQTMGKYLLDQLYTHGVKHIFGIPGDYIIRFDKLIEEHKIQFINATRESTAGYMADAYGRIQGLGAACITFGVGVNIANALSQAYSESSPLVVISGAPSNKEFLQSNHLHHLVNKADLALKDITQQEMFKNITIDQAILSESSNPVEDINRVLKKCLYFKKPIYIELARDIVDLPIDTEKDYELFYMEDLAALEEALEEVASLLKNAKRPIIWAGHEIQRFHLEKPLLAFAEQHNIHIVTSILGKTTIDEFHPLSLGVYQGVMSRPEVARYVESCDCMFILGLIANDIDTGIFTAKLEQDKKVVATQNAINIKHHQFPHISFKSFVHGLSQLNVPNLTFESTNLKKTIPIQFTASRNSKITIKRLIECLQIYITKDHLIVTDVGDSTFASSELILHKNSFISNAYFASLGFGTPGAIGVQFAAPHKRVICLVGDGGFQMTSTELSTALRYHLDPIIIVLNNHGYGTERPILEGSYNDILDWNYSKIPEVLGGGIGLKINSEAEFDSALKQAISTRGSFFILEVNLDKYDFSPALIRLGEEAAKQHKLHM